MKSWLLPALASCAFALPALGQEAAPAGTLPPAILFSQVQPGGTLDSTQANARRIFREFDANGDGRLDAADIAFQKAIAAAGFRASALMRLMGADLDGDGVVTQEELRIRQRFEQRGSEPLSGNAAKARAEQAAAQIRESMTADSDGDGRITVPEAMGLDAAGRARSERSSENSTRPLRSLLEQAGVERLTAAEFTQIAAELFKATDSDGNGTISQDEFNALRKRAEERQRISALAEQRRRAEEARAGCALPKPSAAAKVVLLSTYQGDALSSTTIGSQDIEVRTAPIEVEPGDEPLYVVVLSHSPMIWRFTGAVERVERVVLSARSTGAGSRPDARPLAGASGIAADRVAFLPRPGCLSPFTEKPSIEAAQTIGIVKSETGREPVVAVLAAVSAIAIPSATMQPSRDRQTAEPGIVILKDGKAFSIDMRGNPRVKVTRDDLENDVRTFYPGGIVEIDPATVVASDKPARYEVLPSQAGLLQLVRSGALERNGNREFLIKQKIRFPAGLYGAHSARFLLLRGVPEPEGDPGHSCAVSEETGKPLAGVRTRC